MQKLMGHFDVLLVSWINIINQNFFIVMKVIDGLFRWLKKEYDTSTTNYTQMVTTNVYSLLCIIN
jgi:hypothetical protein